MSSTPKARTIDLYDIDVARLVASPVETKMGGGHKYHELMVKYNFGTSEVPDVQLFTIIGPLLTAPAGIVTHRPDAKNPSEIPKISYSIPISLDVSDDQQGEFYNKLASIEQAYIKMLVDACSSQPLVGISSYKSLPSLYSHAVSQNDMTLVASLFKPSFSESKDRDGKIMSNNYTIWLKLYNGMTQKGKYWRTPVIDILKKDVDWKLMNKSPFKFRPTFTFGPIYIGPKASVQIKMMSALLTEFLPKKSSIIQEQLIHKMIQQDPNCITAYENSLQYAGTEQLPELSDDASTSLQNNAIDHMTSQFDNTSMQNGVDTSYYQQQPYQQQQEQYQQAMPRPPMQQQQQQLQYQQQQPQSQPQTPVAQQPMSRSSRPNLPMPNFRQ